MSELKDRAKSARTDAGFNTVPPFARALGVEPAAIYQIESGKTRSLRAETMAAYERVTGKSGEWLLSGRGPERRSGPAKIHAYEVRAVDGDDGLDGDADVLVDEIDVLLSGGPGSYVPEFVETKYRMPFQVEWFRKHRVKPENVKLMRVNGHSMERTLFDGDRVAVDFADTRLRDGKVYAIAIGGEAKIKRVFNMRDGGYRIVSDNADKDVYPDEVVPGDEKNTVAVLGRAIDRSGSGGL